MTSEKKLILRAKIDVGNLFSSISDSMYGISKSISFKILKSGITMESRAEGNSILYRTELESHKFVSFEFNAEKDSVFYFEVKVSDLRDIFRGTKKKVNVTLKIEEGGKYIYILREKNNFEGIPRAKIPFIEDSTPIEFKYPSFDITTPHVKVATSTFSTDLKTIKKRTTKTIFKVGKYGVKLSMKKVEDEAQQEFPYSDKKEGDEGSKIFKRTFLTANLIIIMKLSKLDKFMNIYVIPDSQTIIFAIDAAGKGTHYVYLLKGEKKEDN